MLRGARHESYVTRVQQSWLVEKYGLVWRIVVVERVDCVSGYALDLDSSSGECKECPAPTSSSAGSDICDLCLAGFYSQQGSCELCPPLGAICPFGATLESMTIAPGFWRTSRLSSHSTHTTVMYECPIPEACAGGTGFGEELCAEGFTGPLCDNCDRHYFPSWGSKKTCKKVGTCNRKKYGRPKR